MDTVISAKGLSKRYGKTEVLVSEAWAVAAVQVSTAQTPSKRLGCAIAHVVLFSDFDSESSLESTLAKVV